MGVILRPALVARAALVEAKAASSPFGSDQTGMSLQASIFWASRNWAGAHLAWGGGVGFARSLAARMLSLTTSPMVNVPGGETRLKVPVVLRSSASITKAARSRASM